jgi:hypothetical protein
VEWALTEACLAGLGSFLQVHAGVVAHRGQGWLLAGPPECGKTSLVLGLVAAGATVLTDEIALIDPDVLHLTPFPRDLIVRRGTERRFAGILPGPVPTFKRFPEHCYLCPADLGPPAVGPLPLTRLIFPRLAPARSPGRRPLGQAEAARRLLDQALNLDRWGGRGVEAVAAMVERCPALEVVFADGRLAARSLLAAVAAEA